MNCFILTTTKCVSIVSLYALWTLILDGHGQSWSITRWQIVVKHIYVEKKKQNSPNSKKKKKDWIKEIPFPEISVICFVMEVFMEQQCVTVYGSYMSTFNLFYESIWNVSNLTVETWTL